MTTVGDILYLPVPRPAQAPLQVLDLKQQPRREDRQTAQHQFYRPPRRDSLQEGYSPTGHRLFHKHQDRIGQTVDIYV